MEENLVTSAGTSNSDGFVVGDVVIESRLRRIRRPEGEFELTQRVYDLLHLFLTEPFSLHSRLSLFERIWGTVHVEDTNLTQNISVLRKALGDERKHWIKTVSRTGYIFEPPTEIRHVNDTREIDLLHANGVKQTSTHALTLSADPVTAVVQATDVTHAVAGQESWPSRQYGKPARQSMLTTFLMFMLFAFMTITMTGSSAMPTPAQANLAGPARSLNMSIIITQSNTGKTDADRLASNLLREWVRWKLSRLPSIDLIDEKDLITGRATPSYFLDLGVTRSDTQPNRFFFSITFRSVYQEDTPRADNKDPYAVKRWISLQGDQEQLPAMVDEASNQAITIILPHKRQEQWPALDLDSDTAARFAEASAASRHHDPNALQLLERVVQEAPKFGPARLMFARELADHKQFRQAAEQAPLAQALSLPLPADATVLLQAETSALIPSDSEKALHLYSLLWAANPARMDLLLAHAKVLQRISRPEAAFQMLSRPEWSLQNGPLRVRQQIARAESAFMLGFLEQSDQSVTEAINRIDSDPKGLTPEFGAAQLIEARMRVQRYGGEDVTELLSKAAITFTEAGYPHDAGVARFYEAVFLNDLPLAEKRLSIALKTAQEYGDHQNQVWMQRMMAMAYIWYYERGKSEQMYKRALESANLASDIPSSQLLEMDLMEEDLRKGDLRQAGQRAKRLQNNQLWTKYRYRAYRVQSDLLRSQGQYHEALAILDRMLGDARRTARQDMPAQEAGSIACARMSLLIDLREVDAARAQAPACSDHDLAEGALGEASLDLLAGDADAARRHMQAAQEDINIPAEAWSDVEQATKLAMLKIRLQDYTDAEKLLRALYKSPAHMNYATLVAQIEVGLAQVAAARDNWTAVSEFSDGARKRLPTDARYFIDQIDALDVSRLRAAGRDREAQAIAAALAARTHQDGGALVAIENDGRRH